jgi:hypothetical protein
VRESLESRRDRARALIRHLDRAYPDAACALRFSTPLELLVATILAAQCTDERVNQVTVSLFQKYRRAADYAAADPATFEGEIRSTGFFRAKTRSVLGMARALVEQHGGERGPGQCLRRSGHRGGYARVPRHPATGARQVRRPRRDRGAAGGGRAAPSVDPLLPPDPGARPAGLPRAYTRLPLLSGPGPVPLARESRGPGRDPSRGGGQSASPPVARPGYRAPRPTFVRPGSGGQSVSGVDTPRRLR